MYKVQGAVSPLVYFDSNNPEWVELQSQKEYGHQGLKKKDPYLVCKYVRVTILT